MCSATLACRAVQRSFACRLCSDSSFQLWGELGTLKARFVCGFELIAREHQKLLGIAISVIRLVLIDFSFSKKPVGFFSKPDVFTESFSQLAAHSHPFVLYIIDRAIDDIRVPRRNRNACIPLIWFAD